MSAKKRRVKRKLSILVRLDQTYLPLYLLRSRKRDPKRADALWHGCIRPAMWWLARRGYGDRMYAALDREVPL